MAPARPKRRARRAADAEAEAVVGASADAEASTPAVATAAVAAPIDSAVAGGAAVGGQKRRKGLRGAAKAAAGGGGGEVEAQAEEAERPPEEEASEQVEEKEKEDRRGIVHLASVPAFMSVQKLRHLMEKFGVVGRIYLAPEDKTNTERRKRSGGNKKVLFTEGWVEFAERKVARRVAETLNGGPIGGKKRHNFWRDDHWNMRYLPKFKWHQLKEGAIYARQVRKARLEQRLGQARRENNFYLEQVEQARRKSRMAEKRAKKGGGAAADGEGPAETEGRFGSAKRRRALAKEDATEKGDWEIPDRMLESLIW